jgi:hypothetical protein
MLAGMLPGRLGERVGACVAEQLPQAPPAHAVVSADIVSSKFGVKPRRS